MMKTKKKAAVMFTQNHGLKMRNFNPCTKPEKYEWCFYKRYQEKCLKKDNQCADAETEASVVFV